MGKAARLHSDLLVRSRQVIPIADDPHGRRRSVWRDGGPEPAVQRPMKPDQRVHLTVRLDRGRHRQLKILAARTGRTGQDLLVSALDHYLASVARSCGCLRGEDGGGD